MKAAERVSELLNKKPYVSEDFLDTIISCMLQVIQLSQRVEGIVVL